MYPVGLCLHVLPGASTHIAAGSWSDLHRSVWERSAFFSETLFKQAGFRGKHEKSDTALFYSLLCLYFFLLLRNPALPFFGTFFQKRVKKEKIPVVSKKETIPSLKKKDGYKMKKKFNTNIRKIKSYFRHILICCSLLACLFLTACVSSLCPLAESNECHEPLLEGEWLDLDHDKKNPAPIVISDHGKLYYVPKNNTEPLKFSLVKIKGSYFICVNVPDEKNPEKIVSSSVYEKIRSNPVIDAFAW